MPDDRFVIGTKVRRGVLGDAQVDASDERTTAFNGDFQRYHRGCLGLGLDPPGPRSAHPVDAGDRPHGGFGT